MQRIGDTPGSWRVRHDRIPPELVDILYSLTRKLAAKGLGPVSVARQLSSEFMLSVSPGTVRHWMVGDRKPQQRNLFKQEPSPALSYVMGANIGDGCTLTDNWIVKLEVTDFDFAETFNTNMATLFSRTRPNKILVRRRAGRLPMYIVKYSSKQLAKLLRLPLKKLLEFAVVFPRDFLRGFFDAEGHVDAGVTTRLDLRVGVENSDGKLLLRVKMLLKELRIISRIERKREAGTVKIIRGKAFVMKHASYSVVIGRIADVRRFAEEIGFSIQRKTQKLKDALSIMATHEARIRPEMWKRLYSKAGGEWVRRESAPFC